MSTPAFIGIQRDPNGPIEGVYCHSGYFEHLSCMLYKYYQDGNKVAKLIELGNLSVVKATLDAVVVYTRELRRPATENRKMIFGNLADLRKERYYSYFIWKNGGWYVSIDARFLHPLHDALEQMGIKPKDEFTVINTGGMMDRCRREGKAMTKRILREEKQKRIKRKRFSHWI
jgi:hypothetical protein